MPAVEVEEDVVAASEGVVGETGAGEDSKDAAKSDSDKEADKKAAKKLLLDTDHAFLSTGMGSGSTAAMCCVRKL